MEEITNNVIIETIKTLGTLLLTISTVGLYVIQFAKEKIFKVDDNKAEILSLLVGFVLSGLVGWYWADSHSYNLVLGQWIGLGLALVLGTIGPSGGYKLLGSLLGSRT